MTSQRAVVIGAGFAGLASAALLARDGYDVTVVEKNGCAGGRAMVCRQDGYTFDMGPSWYMMLEAFERFFAEFGKTTGDYYETVRLDPSYRVFFASDDVVDIHADLARNLDLFDRLEPHGARKLKAFLEKSREQY
ncbi:MAG: phytoene desaturase family protein, partial [Thermoplasmatota archaeon]